MAVTFTEFAVRAAWLVTLGGSGWQAWVPPLVTTAAAATNHRIVVAIARTRPPLLFCALA